MPVAEGGGGRWARARSVESDPGHNDCGRQMQYNMTSMAQLASLGMGPVQGKAGGAEVPTVP